MQAGSSLIGAAPAATPSVRDRILGDIRGPRDEALIFAASSIINEISGARYAGSVVERQVETDAGVYTLQGSRVFGADGAHPVIFVYAEARTAEAAVAAVPQPEALHGRFGLTRKEARVAVLLATHMSNTEIAAELCISPHTARHHTQSVLAKLGLTSRREVGAALAAKS